MAGRSRPSVSARPRPAKQPDLHAAVETWGGVTLFYRKGIKDSPAYRQNHEEINEALDEGIWLARRHESAGSHRG